MTPSSIPLGLIARFSHSGRVFRSFGRLLAARNGSLLAVPVSLGVGDFSTVTDGCPVPWHEVLTAIETPVSDTAVPLLAQQLGLSAPLVAALFSPYGWVQDQISVSDGGRPVCRVISPDNVVFCWIP